MSYKGMSLAFVLALTVAGSAFAQDDTNAAGPGDAVSNGTASEPGQPASPGPSGAGETTTPNAPLHATPDEGPLPAGSEAGTVTASGWSPGPATIAAVSAVAIGAAVCLAVCGGSGSKTSSTTTTTPK